MEPKKYSGGTMVQWGYRKVMSW